MFQKLRNLKLQMMKVYYHSIVLMNHYCSSTSNDINVIGKCMDKIKEYLCQHDEINDVETIINHTKKVDVWR